VIDRIFESVLSDGGLVPAIWPLEVGNGLIMAMRRGRISVPFRTEALNALERAPIAVDPETQAQARTVTLQLADRFRLTLYDAAYLELAQRRVLPLATLDRALAQAARDLGVPAIGA